MPRVLAHAQDFACRPPYIDESLQEKMGLITALKPHTVGPDKIKIQRGYNSRCVMICTTVPILKSITPSFHEECVFHNPGI